MAPPGADTVHATCVAIGGAGVLLVGPSGAGKSDLALRLVDDDRPDLPASLVADDYVQVRAEAGRLVAAAPPAIAGRLEIRGVGIVAIPHVAEAPVALVVELVASRDVERLPERATTTIAGIAVPRIRLDPFEASAPAKVRFAVRALGSGGFAEDIAGT